MGILVGDVITCTDGKGHQWDTVAEEYSGSWRPAVSKCKCGGVYLTVKLKRIGQPIVSVGGKCLIQGSKKL